MTQEQINGIHEYMDANYPKCSCYRIKEEPTAERATGRRTVWLEEVREVDLPYRSYAPLVVEVDFDRKEVIRVVGNLW